MRHSLTFTNKSKRDEFAARLHTLWKDMLHSFDQGHDGRIAVSDEMIDDVRAAAVIVSMLEIKKKK